MNRLKIEWPWHLEVWKDAGGWHFTIEAAWLVVLLLLIWAFLR